MINWQTQSSRHGPSVAQAIGGTVTHVQLLVDGLVVQEVVNTGQTSVALTASFNSLLYTEGYLLPVTMQVWDSAGNHYTIALTAPVHLPQLTSYVIWTPDYTAAPVFGQDPPQAAVGHHSLAALGFILSRHGSPALQCRGIVTRQRRRFGYNRGKSSSRNAFMKRLVLNVAGLFVAIVAVLFSLPSLYLMAAILWLIPAVSYLMGWLMLGGLTCERVLPLSATVGEAIPVTYRLGNVSRLPKFYLLVRDKLPRGLQFAEAPPPLVLSLWPGEEGETQGFLEARRRGVFSLGPAQVFSTDPLGLQTFAQKMPEVAELVVYPALVPIHASWMRGAAAQGWRGTASALTRGSGDDFYGVRQFQPGDELRRVHWRTTARTGTLAVTEYAQGVTLDVTLALDRSRLAYAGTGDGENSALEYAVTLAATLADDLLRHGHIVRLLTAGISAVDALPVSGANAMPRLLETLTRVEADSDQTLTSVLEADSVLGNGATTLVTITPEAQSARLQTLSTDWEARGGQRFGFALDAESFRTGRPGLPDSMGEQVRVVRRGDDLRTILERHDDGWSG